MGDLLAGLPGVKGLDAKGAKARVDAMFGQGAWKGRPEGRGQPDDRRRR